MSIEHIDRYLSGNMDPQERADFEKKMHNDPEFMSEVQQYQKAVDALRVYERSVLKERLKKRGAPQTHSPKKSNSYIWYIVVIIVILLSLWLWNKKYSTELQENSSPVSVDSSIKVSPDPMLIDTAQKINKDAPQAMDHNENEKNQKPQEIYAIHFVPYTDELLESAIRGDDETTAFEKFQNQYANKKFEDAIQTFNSLDPATQNNDNVLFLKANALMATQKFDAAERILESIIKNKESRYLKEAYWYLALCHIRNERFAKARVYLNNSILHGDHRVKAVLEKI
jgi:hypothetical protein